MSRLHLQYESKLRSNSNVFNKWSQLLFVTLMMVLQTAIANECSCSPVVYKWSFDFTKGCPVKLANGSGDDGNFGVAITSCLIDAVDDDTNDLVPVKVTEYQIIELDLELSPLKQQKGTFEGDENKISFSSYTGAFSDAIAGGIQATVEAENAEGKRIELNWIIAYTNLCELNTLEAGDEFGWMVLSDNFVEHRESTCQTPSEPPTQLPTVSPTRQPTEDPTSQPTKDPTSRPSVSPTKAPSPRPTPGPTQLPTMFPTKEPSPRPTSGPSVTASAPPSKTFTPTHISAPSSFPPSRNEPTQISNAPTTSMSKKTPIPSSAPSSSTKNAKGKKSKKSKSKSVKSSKAKKSIKATKKGKASKAGVVEAESLDNMNIVGPFRHRS